MVLLRETTYPEGTPQPGKVGHWGRSYPQHLNHTNLLLNLSFSDRQALAGLTNGTNSRYIFVDGMLSKEISEDL